MYSLSTNDQFDLLIYFKSLAQAQYNTIHPEKIKITEPVDEIPLKKHGIQCLGATKDH